MSLAIVFLNVARLHNEISPIYPSSNKKRKKPWTACSTKGEMEMPSDGGPAVVSQCVGIECGKSKYHPVFFFEVSNGIAN